MEEHLLFDYGMISISFLKLACFRYCFRKYGVFLKRKGDINFYSDMPSRA